MQLGQAPASKLASIFVLSSAILLGLSGCRHTVDDNALASTVQSQLAADSSLNGYLIQATAQGGVVTINGTVQNDAQKTIAARDAAGVAGVKEVRNGIVVAGPGPSVALAAPPPLPPSPPQLLPPAKASGAVPPEVKRQPAPIERNYPPQQIQPQPPPNPPAEVQPPPQAELPQPPAPAPPVYKEITIAAGETIPVRITQTLDSASTQQGSRFTGVVASDIVIDGRVAIAAGSPVSGTVDAVQEAAHYKGSALLTISLASVTRRGEHIALTTDPYTVTGKGRGANTAEKVGGGAAVGAILGGIFGGGKGAAIGAAAGGGVGAGANTVTRGQQVQIESETVVRFHLASPIVVRVRTDPEKNASEGSLQQHPQR